MSHQVLGGSFASHRSSAGNAAVKEPPHPSVDRSFEYALDALTCNAMFCDRELILRYLNRASLKTLKGLQKHLPVPVDQLVGNSIHIFHKSPPTIDKILGARHTTGIHELPHKATIALAL